ncbi:MATE efflux family protein 7-like [Dorcoceras hygrometricum]|uniref:MATE efflux family protein 7-like n=1 Tax=Dorcoceras hygrometricum TaxID=472368 RepID=A0A2Z7D054_9LAMI|nr:MATE efflux family protein 7-like [Dorcoceras hygrometricum]
MCIHAFSSPSSHRCFVVVVLFSYQDARASGNTALSPPRWVIPVVAAQIWQHHSDDSVGLVHNTSVGQLQRGSGRQSNLSKPNMYAYFTAGHGNTLPSKTDFLFALKLTAEGLLDAEICFNLTKISSTQHKSEPAFSNTYGQNTTQVPFSYAEHARRSFQNISTRRSWLPNSYQKEEKALGSPEPPISSKTEAGCDGNR